MTDQSEPKPKDPVVKEISGRIGKYEVVKPLGKGAMGMVYLARDTILERDVALKVMVAGIADDPELKQRFEREAKAVARMTHPNVVTVFDLGYHTDGSPFIAMELLKGQDLQKAMRKQQMSLDRKVAIIVQVLAGLAHAHQQGIIHRDIKPANIFLNSDGSVKIMDFGVARLTTASMTGTGNIVGTADYMSPEQVKGAKVDGRSDVFSVGCMLYELLAGRRPFRAENLMAIFYKITHESPDWDAIPSGPQIDALLPSLKKSLSKNLDERYKTAYEFAVDLREYLKKHATSASGERAIESLDELEPPPEGGPPPPLTGDYDGATVVEGTMDVGAAPGTTPTQRSTHVSGTAATVAGTRAVGAAPTVVSRPGVKPRRPAVRRPVPAPTPSSSGSPVMYGVLGGMAALLAVAGSFIYWTQFREPAPTAPPTTVASLPPTTAPAPEPTATPEPAPTVAPTPTPLSPAGKAARNLRAAQEAFDAGNYEKAVSEAQAALRVDSGNADAKRFLDDALKGQQAQARFAAAGAALQNDDYAKAMEEARAGTQLASWDAQGPRLIQQIGDAQRRAQEAAEAARRQQVAGQVRGLLEQAQQKLGAKDYAGTIALCDQVFELDPGNETASQLKTSAIGAKAIADAAGSAAAQQPAASGKRFVVGKTRTTSGPKQGDVPPGFRTDSGIQAQAATQAAATPGRLDIQVRPETVKPGDQFTIRVRMQNDGTAPIQIGGVMTRLVTNNGRSGGAVPSLVAEVAPRQDAVILEAPGGIWREDTTDFRWEVRVRTRDGATYMNDVEWK